MRRNYYSDRDEERRFGAESRGWGQRGGYGVTGFNDVNINEKEGGFFGKGPKGWKRSDERIREDACEALYRDSEVDASDIDVSVKDNCIFLKGTVSSRQEKRAAERCVENLSGVEDVQNELRIVMKGFIQADISNLS